MGGGDAEPVGDRLQAGGKRRLHGSSVGAAATSRRGPVAGVNGTDACSLG